MEQVITVRITDSQQFVNGKPCGVFADKRDRVVIVTDSSNTKALAKAIGKGVLAARGDAAAPEPASALIVDPNVTHLGPAFDAVAPHRPLRRLDF